MKDAGTSNLSHVSRKPLHHIQVTSPYAGHVVEVTFRSHYNAYDLFSNTARVSSSLFNNGENNVMPGDSEKLYTFNEPCNNTASSASILRFDLD